MIWATGSVPSKDGESAVMDQITQLIAKHFAWALTGQLTVDTRLREHLDLDSLHLVELQVAIEDQFRVTFDPTDEEFLDAFVTVGALEMYVRYLLERGT
jgi:acyl carrier protein